MNEKQEKRRRLNAKIEWNRDFEKWLAQEPSMIRVFAWHRWKKQKPDYQNYLKGEKYCSI